MQEKMMTDLTEFITRISRGVAREVIKEEMTEILESASRPGNTLSDLIDYNKATELLRVSKPTLHAYIKAGRLTKHYVVDGGKPFLSMREIEGMMKKSRRIIPILTVKYFRRTEKENAA